jgi:hypothetical protein
LAVAFKGTFNRKARSYEDGARVVSDELGGTVAIAMVYGLVKSHHAPRIELQDDFLDVLGKGVHNLVVPCSWCVGHARFQCAKIVPLGKNAMVIRLAERRPAEHPQQLLGRMDSEERPFFGTQNRRCE